MKMWLMILIGAIVAVCVFVPTVGLLLPEQYRAKGRLDVALAPEALWERLTDCERYPMCTSSTAKVERLPDVDGRPAWIEDIGSSRLRHVITESDRPRRLVIEAADEVVPMTARWVIEIEPLDSGSRVWVSSDMRIRRGTWHVPIFRLIMTLTKGAQRGTEAYLRSLVDGRATVAWD